MKAAGGNTTVYSIKFYENEQGERPVRDYLKQLGSKTDKDSRIKINKIYDYIETLKEHGTRAGMPFVKNAAAGVRPSEAKPQKFY